MSHPKHAASDPARAEVVDRWWGLHFRDPAQEERFLRELLLHGLARNRLALLAGLFLLLLSGALGFFLVDAPAREAWSRAMTVRCVLLAPIWCAVLLLSLNSRLLLKVGTWVAAAVPLTVLSFTLEAFFGGTRSSGEMRLLYPLLTYLGAGVLFSWASRTLLPVTLASLAAGPVAYLWLMPQVSPTVQWNLWVVWLAVALFLLIGARRREFAERELVLRRERQDRLVEELQAANEELRQLSTLRTEFLTLAAHDLRNPLTIVIGNASALADRTLDPGTPEAEEAIAELVSSGEYMREIVQRFLEEPARQAHAPTTISLRPHSIATLLTSVTAHVQPMLRRKGQHLEVCNQAPGLGLRADLALLGQALENLVSNASKFSPVGGRIWIEARHLDHLAVTRLSVRDEGPGLAPGEEAVLFQRGVRLSARPTAGEPSSGVGLSLVKSWVEIMGGKVGCDSSPGQGACFWITLPHVAVTPPHGLSLRPAAGESNGLTPAAAG